MAQAVDSGDPREVTVKIESNIADLAAVHSSCESLKVPYKEPSSTEEAVRRRHRDLSGEEKHQIPSSSSGGGGREEGFACGSNAHATLRRNPKLFRTKTKSRLLADSATDHRRPRSEKPRLFGKYKDDDDDDPLLDEVMPSWFKLMQLSTFTILELVSLFLIMVALACSLLIPVIKRQTIWDLHLWKWEIMVLVLICGRLVSGCGIWVVVFLILRSFIFRKRVLYFVYALRKAVKNCVWMGLVLIAWHYIFDGKVRKETKSRALPCVTKILVCLWVATLVWLVKTLLVKVVASAFHVNKFFDRIHESVFNQSVLMTLLDPPIETDEHTQEENGRVQNRQNAGAHLLRAPLIPARSGRGLQKSIWDPRTSKKEDQGITRDILHRLDRKNISAWSMKRLVSMVRRGGPYFLHERILNSDIDEDESPGRECGAITKLTEKIFNKVAKPDSEYINIDDLMRFMSEDEARNTVRLIEGTTKSKQISKQALNIWVSKAFQDRKALALSLDDTKMAVDELHHMLRVVVAIIIVVIWFFILGIPIAHFLVLLGSQLLLVTFIFGNTCKTIFEAIIFLFVMHPYDVGDCCEVDGIQMVVEEMNILTTVFLRHDYKMVIYPNSVLANMKISNYYRSPEMGDAIDFSIPISTPMEKIAIMKERIKGYIQSNNDHWLSDPMVITMEVEDMNRLKMVVCVRHRMNHQDMGESWTRRAHLVEHMINVFRELDIEYRILHVPGLISNRLPSNWPTSADRS